MTEIVNIPIKRTGFPVKIGEVELWFDSSFENLKRFFNVEELAVQRLEEIRKKAEHVHFPEEITEENIDEIKDEDINTAFDVNKEFIAIQYDLLFGNDSFKKIYKEYPDVIALEVALDTVGGAIASKINEEEAERTKKYASKRSELLNKKNQKKK
ncbi:hypothetical protein [Alkalibacterium sp. MB6]|uniref:hypothetical protein n=1 Tax=Alkalibacterium sp. MB6 TaxID=2081965 RepID=UPI00137A9A63|nr:hypothetical protein [Alkalibacterium sp. MB6]